MRFFSRKSILQPSVAILLGMILMAPAPALPDVIRTQALEAPPLNALVVPEPVNLNVFMADKTAALQFGNPERTPVPDDNPREIQAVGVSGHTTEMDKPRYFLTPEEITDPDFHYQH